MKIKFTLLFLFLLIVNVVKSQDNTVTLQESIKWTGIDTWSTGKATKQVISFEDASYPDNNIPYFVKLIDCEKNANYTVELSNPTYIPLDAKEINIVKGEDILSEVEVLTSALYERGNKYLKIQVKPFVQKDGKILKLQNFSLNIKKNPAPLKTPADVAPRTYATSSVLANGKFVKVKISESGIYKLTYENLASMGINPAEVRVFGYGGAMLDQNFLSPKKDDLPETAIYMNKGADGIFNAGDYILFYAQGVNSWKYDASRKMFTHTLNVYSNEGYYFITSDAGVGKKLTDYSVSVPSNSVVYNVDEFVDYQVHEKEAYSIVSSGKVLYGEKFDDVTTYNFPFSFPNIVKNASTRIRVDLMAATSKVSSNYTLKLNGAQQQTIPVPAISEELYEFGKAVNYYFTFTPTTDDLIANLTYVKPTTSARGYLNYLEVNARRKLIMSGSTMFFRNVDNLSSIGTYNKFQLSGANESIQIWDITDPQNVQRVSATYSNGVIEFTDVADQIKQYVAINPTIGSSFSQPTIGEVVPNQNLHGMSATDFVIITHPRFISQANQLAEEHRKRDNMRVQVVTTDQVYNEFSSGAPDATAYRWVVKMLYDRALALNATQDIPKYLLLFGRGSYDNRKLLLNSSESLVLTYQSDESLHSVHSYTSDDYFGLLDDSEGTDVANNLMDVGVGRFTVLTDEQATNVVTKTINYIDNKQKGIWKNQICFVGDDGGLNDGNTHMSQADSVARIVGRLNKSIQLNKIYLDAYKQEVNASGDSYPLARAKLLSLLNSGVFMVNYTGHAGSTGWADEQVLTTNDVKNLYNSDLPLWIAATCDFVAVDANKISAGENVLLNPSGGGIGIFAAARTVYSGGNFVLNKSFCRNLFSKTDGKYPRLGDVMRNSKRELRGDENKLPYGLFADPALQLVYPSQCQVITDRINDKNISGNDTIRALSVDSIQGHIEDLNGNILSDYNGIVEINIYDKNQRITTLNNHNESNGVLVFDDRPNIIYSGKASVVNGNFIFKFMVPKDIRYNYGTGRINYYVSETNSDRDGQGYFENFIVGGGNSNYDKTDTIGPDVKMYLNYKTFVLGDKVNETPLFVANIADKNGINTVGSGIGHDLRLVIDDNPLTSYTLNEYFFAQTNSYTSGDVQYKIPTLPEGKHTLTFHAWDLLNNSSIAKLDFEVVNGLTPSIFGVSCYPNPANVRANFVVVHDRPETVLEITVEVFDLVGRKIWAKTQSSSSDLTWNLTNQNGLKVQNGIYLYRISIKTDNSNLTSKTNKIIINSMQ